MWEKDKCDKGGKGMARKNQQDISFFDPGRHRLIDDLEINDFRVRLPPKKQKTQNHQNKTQKGSLTPKMPCLKVNWFER